jgi:hypothetical protein
MPNFYGKQVNTLKLFGQRRWGDCSPGRVTGGKIFHAAGVVVDRSSTPNHIYVADTGNSRILGFRSYDSRNNADLIMGQLDEFSGAPNGDCNTGVFAEPTRASMCLLHVPPNPNLAEQWMRLNMDVDAEGNLYVPDFHNNRVLIFNAPFKRRLGLRKIVPPDRVLGQPDFKSNGINRGNGPNNRDARSLYLSFGGFDHVASRGVSVDGGGNVWVADTFNYRVLRFPKGARKADLVLGQPNFTDSDPTNEYAPENAPTNRMCTPTLARVNPDTGELYVIDEYPGGFRARILVFEPPFTNGMRAARMIFPEQRLEGDFAPGVGCYRFAHATGLVFNPFKTDDWIDETTHGHRYRDGIFWVHDTTRTLLLDATGKILLAIGAPDVITRGGRYDVYGRVGMSPETPFNLIWPGGMMGFDSQNNIYLADDHFHRIARYALPYRVRQTPQGPALPETNGGLFPGTLPNNISQDHISGPGVGAITFRNQLIVRDTKRYMAWNEYRSKMPEYGAPADVIVGQASGDDISQDNLIYGRGMHTIDDQNRLWTCSAHGKLMVYQLPLTNGAPTLKELIPLYWADEPPTPPTPPPTEIPYRCEQPLAFDHRLKKLWVYDTAHHRLLRVKNPEDVLDGNLLVDAVIGQSKKTDGAINRGMPNPDAASFGDVNDIKFDKMGNLFVVDNTYECHPNGRIIAFLAEDLASIDRMFPDIKAKKVYVVDRFDETTICRIHDPVERPHSPVSVAFNSRNEMVVGNDGYYRDPATRHLNQLYLYRNPLTKATPDAVIDFPMGTPGELSFDEEDNLIIQDHTWNKIWIINFDRDPVWLRSL